MIPKEFQENKIDWQKTETDNLGECRRLRHPLSWFERHEPPDYFYGQERGYAYWDYKLVAYCHSCEETIFVTGGRRNGLVGANRNGWFVSSSSIIAQKTNGEKHIDTRGPSF